MRRYPRTVELAAVPEKQLLAYVKFLYVGVVAISQGEVPEAVVDVAKGWIATAKAVDAKLESDLVRGIIQVIRTGDVNLDLSPYVKPLRASLRVEVYANTKISHQVVDNLKGLTSYLSSRSETAYRKLMNLSVDLDPVLSNALSLAPKSQKAFLKPLERIVFAATQQKGRTTLTAIEAKELKATHPLVYKEYLKLRASFNLVWKDELRALVNNSGKKAVSYQAARKQLSAAGIQNTLSDTFVGLIDAAGGVYTTKGKRIPGLPGPGFTVRMNPDYNPVTDDVFVFTTVSPEGKTSQYVYTNDYRKKAVAEKFAKVDQLDQVIDDIRAKWFAAVKRGKNPLDFKTQASVLLELLYQFSARIGSSGNRAGGKDTFGLSTILVRDVKITGTQMKISYLGKDAVRQIHVLDSATKEGKILFGLIKPLLEGKAKTERVWIYKNGEKMMPMTGNLVNKLFLSLGAPEKTTVHKIRHVRGTRLFKEIMEREGEDYFAGPQRTDAQALALIKELATQVGTLLGHVRGVGESDTPTGDTALANYIDPAMQARFFDKFKVRYPKYLDKLLGN